MFFTLYKSLFKCRDLRLFLAKAYKLRKLARRGYRSFQNVNHCDVAKKRVN